MRHYDGDDEPYVVIERHEGSVGSFLTGLAIGVGLAILFAPRSGRETRRRIRTSAERASQTAVGIAQDMTDSVVDTFQDARQRVEERIDTARQAVELKRRQVARAMEAGREAAQQARSELERRLAETKAAYQAGAEVAHTPRAPRPPAVPRVPESGVLASEVADNAGASDAGDGGVEL
ncbi:MAG TPA: YtxH domain-containing protein [Gemmatimonadaceae bacterium]|nr:YtxH domain-containing protein [Gemmatimonadaceae bacterium]